MATREAPNIALRRLRDERHLSQVELAAAAGLDQATVSRIERGQDCYVSVLVKIARALDVSLDALVPKQ